MVAGLLQKARDLAEDSVGLLAHRHAGVIGNRAADEDEAVGALGPPVKRFAGEYSGNGYKSKFKALVSRSVEKLIDRDAAFRKPLCVMLV